jgi:hypothetical protein
MKIFGERPPAGPEKFDQGGNMLLRGAMLFFHYLLVTACALSLFYSSLLFTSQPLRDDERATVDRTIDLLAARGFRREAVLLRHATAFRRSDNWLNSLAVKENAFASTNFPFGVITLYPDFYHRATDDTERAMILLHEARHLQGGDEADAYAYVWENRGRLGWTMLSHGTTETFVTVELLTRDAAPELFTCPHKLWNDCTEPLPRRAQLAEAR